MARRATIADIAREAGVSVASVDRVLNGRQRVREETARRIYDAAERVGHYATPLIQRRLNESRPLRRLGFVLRKERQAFYQIFADEIARAVRASPDVRGQAIVEFAATQGPAEVAEQMRKLGSRVDALAATAVNHQTITAAVTELKAAGVPTFSLLSDFAQGERAGYIGLNNLKVGRLAACMIGGMLRAPGKIALFVGGHRWHGHELRETGFRSYFREFHPDQILLDTLVNLETRQLTYEATLDLLARHRDLRGLYLAGGGMEGAIAALREARGPGEVALAVNELTPESRAALTDRYAAMAIATPLAALGGELVRLMAIGAEGAGDRVPGQFFLEPQLYLPESI